MSLSVGRGQRTFAPLFFSRSWGFIILVFALVVVGLFLRVSGGVLAENAASDTANDLTSSFTQVRNTIIGIPYYYKPFISTSPFFFSDLWNSKEKLETALARSWFRFA